MLLLGLDFETTGLDTENDQIIEIGAVLYDTKIESPVIIMNEILKQDVELAEEIQVLTGILPHVMKKHGTDPKAALKRLLALMKKADAVVAHNGELFDKPIFQSNLARHGLQEPEILWIDTSMDVPYPESVSVRKLTYLAVEHGFMNPFPHRAFSDVLTMLKIMDQYDLDEVLKLAKSPSVLVRAMIPKPWDDDGKGKDAAKESGFRWDGDKKRWIQRVKECSLEDLKSRFDYPVKVLEE